MMDEHRNIIGRKVSLFSCEKPFSSFKFVDQNLGAEQNPAIRRLFSLARSLYAKSLLVEEIEPCGIISDEKKEIEESFSDYIFLGLERISFWTSNCEEIKSSGFSTENLAGYAILKHDKVPSKNYDCWHIFESVFKKYPHPHNCVPNPMEYKVTLGDFKTSISGLLYAQQNNLNKACAQVSLRSLITRIIKHDISYRTINEFAEELSGEPVDKPRGLTAKQIQSVLKGVDIRFRDFDYSQYSKEESTLYRRIYPYQKYVYSGVECGTGALVGFHLTGPAITETKKHIIPFYGHTFNKDTWAPDADIAYFRVGEELGYLPSENWTSSFLGHDDNFGANFCVPRLYIKPDDVDYVVELLRPGTLFGGAQAEALALQFLYSVLNQINKTKNDWLDRLIYYASKDIQKIVLRALSIDKSMYINHLKNETDWEGNHEDPKMLDLLSVYLPNNLWIVEISIPQLFPGNEHKLGEIALNGSVQLSDNISDRSHLLFVRLPGEYVFDFSDGKDGRNFLKAPSDLISHLPVMRIS
jgi:hypothetical protein